MNLGVTSTRPSSREPLIASPSSAMITGTTQMIIVQSKKSNMAIALRGSWDGEMTGRREQSRANLMSECDGSAGQGCQAAFRTVEPQPTWHARIVARLGRRPSRTPRAVATRPNRRPRLGRRGLTPRLDVAQSFRSPRINSGEEAETGLSQRPSATASDPVAGARSVGKGTTDANGSGLVEGERSIETGSLGRLARKAGTCETDLSGGRLIAWREVGRGSYVR